MNQYWKGDTQRVPEPDEYVEVPYHEHVKFVCRCGNDTFKVYALHSQYITYVECLSCGLCDPGFGGNAANTVVHNG